MAQKHPGANFLRALIIENRQITDAQLQRQLEDWGFLTADPTMLPLLRAEIPDAPQGFDPTSRVHRTSVRFLRQQRVYEYFHQNEAMREALSYLGEPQKRVAVEQMLMGRVDVKFTCKRLNAKCSWKLTEEGVKLYQHYFWNVNALTLDEWGRFMSGRTALYDRYMNLLSAPPKVTMYRLRLEQQIESKKMIQRVQEIAYFALEEIDAKYALSIDNVKSINLLSKVVIEAHNALSTSDMALRDTLKQFEQWRMEHPEALPPAMKQLAPAGNFTGSGIDPHKKNGATNGHAN